MSSKIRKQRRRLVIPILLITFFATGTYILGWSAILSVQALEIKGTKEILVIEKKLAMSNPELAVGKPLARLNLAGAKKSLLNMPWTQKVELHRNWINRKITISVVERKPVAVYRVAASPLESLNSAVYLDKFGVEFKSPAPVANLPEIELANRDTQIRKSAALFISTMPTEILSKMSGLLINADATIDMKTSFRTPMLLIHWGKAAELETKIAVLRRILILPENKIIKVIDLTNSTAPIVS